MQNQLLENFSKLSQTENYSTPFNKGGEGDFICPPCKGGLRGLLSLRGANEAKRNERRGNLRFNGTYVNFNPRLLRR